MSDENSKTENTSSRRTFLSRAIKTAAVGGVLATGAGIAVGKSTGTSVHRTSDIHDLAIAKVVIEAEAAKGDGKELTPKQIIERYFEISAELSKETRPLTTSEIAPFVTSTGLGGVAIGASVTAINQLLSESNSQQPSPTKNRG